MAAPIIPPQIHADAIACDVPGCGRAAASSTDGTEKDGHTRRVALASVDGIPDWLKAYGDRQGVGVDQPMARPAVPYVNICGLHRNWPHSEDAQAFARGAVYQQRLASLPQVLPAPARAPAPAPKKDK